MRRTRSPATRSRPPPPRRPRSPDRPSRRPARRTAQVPGLASAHVERAPAGDRISGDPKPDRGVGGPPSATVELVVAVLGHDVVAQEPGSAGAGVRDQRLRLGQFQLELLAQELAQPLLDLHRFALGSAETEENVVGVPDVAQPTIARIAKILAGQGPAVLAQG